MKRYIMMFMIMATSLLMGCEAKDKNPTFAGIEWGSTVLTTQQELEAAGFKVKPHPADNTILLFTGELQGHEIRGLALSSSPKADGLKVLSKIEVTVDKHPLKHDVFKTYTELNTLLVQRYGVAKDGAHTVSNPNGSYLENIVAYHAGEGYYADVWENDERGGGLSMSIDADDIKVRITYESVQFAKYADARAEKNNSAL